MLTPLKGHHSHWKFETKPNYHHFRQTQTTAAPTYVLSFLSLSLHSLLSLSSRNHFATLHITHNTVHTKHQKVVAASVTTTFTYTVYNLVCHTTTTTTTFSTLFSKVGAENFLFEAMWWGTYVGFLSLLALRWWVIVAIAFMGFEGLKTWSFSLLELWGSLEFLSRDFCECVCFGFVLCVINWVFCLLEKVVGWWVDFNPEQRIFGVYFLWVDFFFCFCFPSKYNFV